MAVWKKFKALVKEPIPAENYRKWSMPYTFGFTCLAIFMGLAFMSSKNSEKSRQIRKQGRFQPNALNNSNEKN